MRRITSQRRGAFSSRDRVGCEHRSPPVSGSRSQASLRRDRCAGHRDRRNLRRPQQIAKMRARIMSAKLWVTRVGSRRSGISRARRSAIPSRRSARDSNMTPQSEVRRPPSKAAVPFFRSTAGRSKDGTVSSTMASVALREVSRTRRQHQNPTPLQCVKLRSPPILRRPDECDGLSAPLSTRLGRGAPIFQLRKHTSEVRNRRLLRSAQPRDVSTGRKKHRRTVA